MRPTDLGLSRRDALKLATATAAVLSAEAKGGQRAFLLTANVSAEA